MNYNLNQLRLINEMEDYGSQFIYLRDEINKLKRTLSDLIDQARKVKISSPDIMDLESDKDRSGGYKHLISSINRLKKELKIKENELNKIGSFWKSTLNDYECHDCD